MNIFKKEMSKDEKLMSIKALLINLVGNFQKYKKLPPQILDSLYSVGIYDNSYDGILLQKSLKTIENSKSVQIIIRVTKERIGFNVNPTSRKKLKPLLGSIVKDNGLFVGVIYDDDEYCPSSFLNERILRGEYLGTILNTALGKEVMERCGYTRKDTENNQKED